MSLSKKNQQFLEGYKKQLDRLLAEEHLYKDDPELHSAWHKRVSDIEERIFELIGEGNTDVNNSTNAT